MRCTGQSYCKSEAEITAFFRDKWLLFLKNQIRFDQGEYGESSIKKESLMGWHSINTQYQMTIPFKVTKTQLDLQDLHIDLDDLTELTSEYPFKLEQMPTVTYEKDDIVQMEFTVEINSDLLSIERHGYTMIDLLSDVGGVQTIFVTLIGLFLSLWNYEHFDTTIAS